MIVKKKYDIRRISQRVTMLLLIALLFQAAIAEPSSKQDLSTLLNEARGYMQGGDYEKAILMYNKVLDLEPNNVSALNNKGIAQYRLGLCNQSTQTLKRALIINNTDINLQMNLIYSQLCDGDFVESEHLMNDAIKNHPENAGLWLAKGIWNRQQANLTEAIEFLNTSIRLEPRNPEIWYELAKTTALSGSLDEAYTQILYAENLSPNDLNIRYYRGVLEERREMYKDALETFDKVIESDPNNTWAWFSRGSIYWNHQVVNRSLESFTKVNEIDPNISKAWFFSGLAYKESGQYNKSKSSFENAYKLEPENSLYRSYYERYTTYTGDSLTWDDIREKTSLIFFCIMVGMGVFFAVLAKKKMKN